MSAFWPCLRQEVTLQVRAGLPILACLYCTSIGIFARFALAPEQVSHAFPSLLLLVTALPSFFGACFLLSVDLRCAPLIALRATLVSTRSYYQAKLASLLALASLQSALLVMAAGLVHLEELLLLLLGMVGANLLAVVAGMLAARKQKAPFFWLACSIVFLILLLVVPATEQALAQYSPLAVCSPFSGPYALVRGGLERIPTSELFLQLGSTLLWCAAAYFLGERRIHQEFSTVPG